MYDVKVYRRLLKMINKCETAWEDEGREVRESGYMKGGDTTTIDDTSMAVHCSSYKNAQGKRLSSL
jgi:hypothetical protein